MSSPARQQSRRGSRVKGRLRPPPWDLNHPINFRVSSLDLVLSSSRALLALQGSTGTTTETASSDSRTPDATVRDSAHLSEEPAASETHFSYIYVHFAGLPESIILVTLVT